MVAKAAEATTINLMQHKKERVRLTIVGDTPLITHKFSEKMKKQMLEAQVKNKVKAPKEPQNPEQEFIDATYFLEDGRPGFPSVAVKAATVNAATLFPGVTKVALKQAIKVIGEGAEQLIAIEGSEPEMREDVVRVGMGTAALRYRPQFWPWSAQVEIEYIPTAISLESIIALVDAGGSGGICEWRPSAPKSYTGSYGTYHVDHDSVTVMR